MGKQFKTFAELEEYLKGHTDLCMTRKYLQDRIKEEVSFLVKDYKKKHPTIDWGPSSNKRKALDVVKVADREDYLEDINYFLLNNELLTHMSVMGYRRKPHAWAIADAIKEFEKG